MRRPVAIVVAGGVAVAGVESVSGPTAGRFSLVVAGDGAALADPDVRVEIGFAVDGVEALVLVGRVDWMERDVLRGSVRVEGRDLAGLLIESRPEALYVNRTAGDIARSLAGAVGLGCDAVAGGEVVGRLYGAERDRLQLARFARAGNGWDQLALLAAAEGGRVWMEGEVLRFGVDDGGSGVVVDAGVVTGLRVVTETGLLRGVEVAVASWGTRVGQVATGQAGASGGVRHRIVRPNLAPAEAQALAERAVAQVVRHARRVEVEMPGELAMRAGGVVSVVGVPGLEGAWRVTSLRRRLDVRRGFTQSVVLEAA